jgi:hypothetical protein
MAAPPESFRIIVGPQPGANGRKPVRVVYTAADGKTKTKKFPEGAILRHGDGSRIESATKPYNSYIEIDEHNQAHDDPRAFDEGYAGRYSLEYSGIREDVVPVAFELGQALIAYIEDTGDVGASEAGSPVTDSVEFVAPNFAPLPILAPEDPANDAVMAGGSRRKRRSTRRTGRTKRRATRRGKNKV